MQRDADGRPLLPDDRPRRNDVALRARTRFVAATMAGLLASLVAFVFRTIPISSDPWHYVHAGVTFPERSWNLVGLTRYGMVMPTVALTRLFHVSEATFYLPPLLATALLVGSMFWLAARFFGFVAATAAAVLLMANSVVLLNATRMYPDLFAVAATSAAVMLAVAARDRWQAVPRTTGRLLALLVLTGAAVGLSWWMRETAFFAWPVVGLILVWRGGPPLRLVLPAAGGAALAFWVAELAVGQWAFGDPWVRLKALSGANLSQTTSHADMQYLGQSRLTYLETIPRNLLAFADARWVLAMAVVAVLGGLAFPRKVGLFAGWFVLVLGCFLTVGGVLHPQTPRIRLDLARYWLAFLPPMVVAAVGTVAVLARLIATHLPARFARPSYRLVVAVVLALALVAGPVRAAQQQVRATPAYVVTNHDVMNQLRAWLQRHDGARILTDGAGIRILPVYTRTFWGRPLAHVHFAWLRRPHATQPGDYVMLFSAYNNVCEFCRSRIDGWVSNNPRHMRTWPKVWQTSDRTFVVYRVPRSPTGR